MNGFASTFKATRSRMVELDSEALSETFHEHFGMSEGDYLEINQGSGWIPCRIMAVRQCYWNQAGGQTAYITVGRLTRSGHVGTSRGLTICVGGKHKKLTCLGGAKDTEIRRK